jgi:hypothetical protein
MQVTVGSYYEDKAKGTQREVHVSLNDEDGQQLFPNWSELPVPKRASKLTAMADIMVLKYALERGYRAEDTVQDEVANLIKRELSD